MNGQNGHVDGDDYTYDAPTGGAVFNPLAELAAWDQAGAGPDLRTADQVEREDVAALRRDVDSLRAMTIALAKVLQEQIDRLEWTVAELVRVSEVRLP